MKINLSKIVNICMVLAFIFVLYLFGSILFGYKLPEFIQHHKTDKEIELQINEETIPIKFKELKAIMHQRDSLQDELNKCKEWSH